MIAVSHRELHHSQGHDHGGPAERAPRRSGAWTRARVLGGKCLGKIVDFDRARPSNGGTHAQCEERCAGQDECVRPHAFSPSRIYLGTSPRPSYRNSPSGISVPCCLRANPRPLRCLIFRGSIPPHPIAVYASLPLSPVATQHSLPSGRYPLLGPDSHRLDRTSLRLAHVAVGTCVSSRAPRTEPYERLSRIRLPPRVQTASNCRMRSSACVMRASR